MRIIAQNDLFHSKGIRKFTALKLSKLETFDKI